MGKTKKILSFLIALIMVLSLVPFNAIAYAVEEASGTEAQEQSEGSAVASATVSSADEFSSAIAEAQAGDTIKVTADITGFDVTVNKDITLDLGGKTITDAYIKIKANVTIKNGSIKNVNESYPLVVKSGSLTVEEVNIDASKSDRAIWLDGTVTLNFNSGSILATKGENNSNSKIYGVWVCAGATANINGGTITVDAGPNATAVAIFGNYVNTVNINGGKISTSGKTYSYAVYTEGDVTVTGGEIVTNEKQYGYTSGITYGKNYAIYTKGDVEISGGKITTNGPSGYLVSASGSGQTVEISNVEFTNVLSEADRTAGGHNEPNLIYGSNVTTTITGGSFEGVNAQLVKGTGSTATVSGGEFSALDTSYVANGSTVTVAGTNVTKDENGNITEAKKPEGSINGGLVNVDDANRTFLTIESWIVYANESIVVKVYDENGTLLATAALVDNDRVLLGKENFGLSTMVGINCTDSWWDVTWEKDKLRADYVPAKATLFVDGAEMNTAIVQMRAAGTEAAIEWADVPGVFAAPSATVEPEGNFNIGYLTGNYNFKGYSAIYGEATGVIGTESFVVKLYRGETLVGTATLVDDEKVLLNGVSKSISWHACLTDEGDGDTWWKTDWENGSCLTADTIPDNAVLYVDGVEVSSGEIKTNSADNSYPVLGVLADASGAVTRFVTANGYVGNMRDIVTRINEAIDSANDGDTLTIIRDLTVNAGEVITLDGVNLTVAEGVTLTNNGTIEVYGTVALNIPKFAGNSIDLCEGAIVKDSNVNGPAYVAGNVTFRGKNTFTMITDFGDYYSKTTPSMWTVEKGASLTLTKSDRYGLGYGDKVTVYGSIEDALNARENLTDSDASINMYGGLVGMTNSAAPNAQNKFTAEDAYLIFGVVGDKSFGNKPGSYYGNYEFVFTNSVVTANGFKFYEDKGTSSVVFVDSDLLVNGVFMTNDVSSSFKFTNCVIVSKATSNGSDDKNQNAGAVTLIGTSLTYNAPFTNAGTIVLDLNSSITAPSLAGAGSIIIDATGFNGTEVKLLNIADMNGFTGTISVENCNNAQYEIRDGGIYIVEKEAEPVAEVNGVKYESLVEAFKAATEGCTIEILADVTVDYKWDCRDYATNGSHSQFKESVTINGNGKTIKFTGTVNDNNWNTIFRFEENATVNNITIDISEATGAQRVISAKKSLTVDGLTIVGAAKYGVIFGEGASAEDLANTEIVIKNSELNGTRRAISDNEGGKDVKSVTITDNTLNANTCVSAYGSIVFTGNTVTDAYVDLRSYTADNKLNVTATGNTLEANTETTYNYIQAGGTVDAQEGFVLPKVYVAQIGEQKFESISAAVEYALENNITDLVITIIGTNDKTSVDAFNLYETTAFDSVTIKQENGGAPYYVESIYTGKRTNNGTFVFDGVNLVITGQYITQCKTYLKNNSTVTRTNDAKNFIYYADMYVEAGSKYISQIDDILGGKVTVDGGELRSIYFDVRAGQVLVIKNNGYVLLNASDEIGRLTLNGKVDITGSKLEVFNNIVMGANSSIELDIESLVSANVITGNGTIVIDATGIAGRVQVIKANMANFTGTIEVIGGDYEVTADGVYVTEKKAVASVNGVGYESLQAAIDAAQAGDTIVVLESFVVDTTVVIEAGKSVTIDLNGYSINAGWADEIAGKHIYVLDNKGTLTINDSVGGGAINTRGIFNYGTMTLAGGDINCLDVNGGYGVINYSNAIFTMNDGSINSWEDEPSDPAVPGNYDATAFRNEGTAYLNGGSITSTGNYVYAVSNTGTLTVNGTSIKGRGGIATYSGVVTIKSGTVQNDIDNNTTGHAVYVEGGKVVIEGGSFVATNDQNDGNSVVYVAVGATAEISGGTFTTNEYTKAPYGPEGNTIAISGGIFDKAIEEKYCAEGYVPVDNGDGTYGVEEAPKYNITIAGKTLSLDAAIQVNLYFAKASFAGAYEIYAVVQVGTKEAYVIKYGEDGWAVGQNGYAYDALNIKGIAAKEMGDVIRVQFYVGNPDDEVADVKASDEITYSVKEYAYTVIGLDSQPLEAKQSMYALLKYGAAAQKYFKYNTENLVDADLTEEMDQAYATSDAAVTKTQIFIKGQEYRLGNTMSLDDSPVLNYYFNTFHKDEYRGKIYATATYIGWDNKEHVITIKADEIVYDTEKGQTLIAIRGLSGADVSSDITLRVFAENGETLFESVYSIEAYLKAAMGAYVSDAYLYQALANYGATASAYLKKINNIK